MIARYVHLWFSLAKFSLLGELAFRGNFLIKVFVELLWLGLLLLFNVAVFQQTGNIASWDVHQYLFFIGCYIAMAGVIETLFLENCNQFADLVRSGDLDFFLLKPIDEQFLISFRNIDWSCVPNVVLGFLVMAYALWASAWEFDPLKAINFVILFTCGAALAYGFLLTLTSASVWFMRNQSLYEVWWLFSTLMRYPREIFKGPWAEPAGWFFSFIVPVMLVTNVPANVMMRVLEPSWIALYAATAAVIIIIVSRRVFRMALQRYRSASS